MVLAATTLHAAPPVDLAGDVNTPAARPKTITQDDLVYTDNLKPDETPGEGTARVTIAVVGRSLPGRAGKPLHAFQPKDLVKILKESSDHRWYAIETVHVVGSAGKKRGWVPKNSVRLPPPPEAAPKPTDETSPMPTESTSPDSAASSGPQP